MPLPPPPANLLAQIQSKKPGKGAPKKVIPFGGGSGGNNALLASIKSRQAAAAAAASSNDGVEVTIKDGPKVTTTTSGDAPGLTSSAVVTPGKLFMYNINNKSKEEFHFDLSSPNAISARLIDDAHGNAHTDINVPLAPCVYRMTDYTYKKQEPILLSRCVNKLGVLRCLARECTQLNTLLWNRISVGGSMEESELGKARFMELLSNCGVYQEISELILKRCNDASDNVNVAKKKNESNNKDGGGSKDYENGNNPFRIPQIHVEGLGRFLQTIEDLVPSLATARSELTNSQTVSFHPGLGELFSPGSQLVCHPEGMEGTPLGVSVVQSWYDEELNRATNKVKRRFILVVEFVVSVGTELVFVAASEVYPEFHDVGRNVPVKDLNHRRIDALGSGNDAELLQRLQNRGEFYASVATDNHYLEYHPNSFFPIIGGWGNNAVRPLSKSGRVMVDVKRGFVEGHIPIRGSSDGMSDTVKESMKLFDQSKRTGVAVPFRTAILPEFSGGKGSLMKDGVHGQGDSDRHHLWQCWPMLTGFSFTARVWGKLLLSLPKASSKNGTASNEDSPVRPSTVKMGVAKAALGGVGRAGNVNYIKFQEKAFDQLVLAEDKKELIRAVARNAGGGSKFDDELSDEDEEDDDEIGLDVVANKGAASIFLLSGPPGKSQHLYSILSELSETASQFTFVLHDVFVCLQDVVSNACFCKCTYQCEICHLNPI